MKKAMLNNPKQLVLTAAHPSPLSASRGFFSDAGISARPMNFWRKTGLPPLTGRLKISKRNNKKWGKKNDNTLVKNASFLMIAALISKIIGMLYKSPLSNTLGNNSMGLFNYAQNVYFILLMIASFSIPQAVSKIMAEKLAFKRYRDAQKVFHCALLYVIIMGGVVALFCLFGSSILVPESMSEPDLH